ncbi:hypothetical protein [Hymenobacter ginkgonis]|uniref:hypothetical protein n=1 Tax=Hymenobacter ginkgonis TaxID=2682976 RepID=UPI001E3B939D|nr:hypothetical protein [Hymenobacter ginkgonis]
MRTGFLAQEVEATARQLGFRFDGIQVPANARDHYSLGYAQFVVPLVRAVQELSTENEALKARLATAVAKSVTMSTELQTLRAQATATTEAFETRLRRLETAIGGQAQR